MRRLGLHLNGHSGVCRGKWTEGQEWETGCPRSDLQSMRDGGCLN